ncbi:TfuA-like protein [Verrucomicrobia bacterium]|nr:TfuA-like protein [Verrucomicrobiota bacterium]
MESTISNYATAVFLGPSLPIEVARRILPADYYPPAQMGDVYHILGAGLKQILIIDGVFHGAPSIWHREILEALRAGIIVYGACSMGALRAAELEPFGMIGLGKIFGWYKSGLIEGDDEVALVHGDKESDYLPMTVPLVNVRETLGRMRMERLINANEASLLLKNIRSICYLERTSQAIKNKLNECKFIEGKKDLIFNFFHERLVNLKSLDAVQALKILASDKFSSHSNEASWPIPARDDYYACTRVFFRRLSSPSGQQSKVEDLIKFICKDPESIGHEWHRINTRIFTLLWAESLENPPIEKFIKEYKKKHSETLGIKEIDQWLKVNNMTKAEYITALSQAGLLIWIHSICPSEVGIDFDSHKQFFKGFVEWRKKIKNPLSEAGGQVMIQRLAQTCFHWQWAKQRGIRHNQSIEESINRWENKFLIKNRSQWLATVGISNAQYLQLQNERMTSEFLIEKGPHYFGVNRYCIEEELLVELQMSGRLLQFPTIERNKNEFSK